MISEDQLNKWVVDDLTSFSARSLCNSTPLDVYKAGLRKGLSTVNKTAARILDNWPSDEKVDSKVNELVNPILRSMMSRTEAYEACTNMAEWLKSQLTGEAKK